MLKRLIGLVVICISAVSAHGQALADRVPEKVLLYAGWQGSDSLGPAYAGSHLKGFLDSSNFPQLFNDFLPRLMEKFGGQDPQFASGMQLLTTIGGPMWRHPSAFFIANVELNAGQMPAPHLALICDAGADARKLEDELKKQAANIPPGGPPVNVTRDDALVIMSLGYAEGELKLPRGKAAEGSLAGDANLQKMLGEVGKGRAATFYLDAEGVLATVDKAVQMFADAENKEQWGKVRDALGLSGLKQVVAGSGFDGKDWGTSVFIGAPAPRKGLLAMLDSKPLSDNIFAAIPRDATIAGAGHLDLAALVQQIHAMVAKIDDNAAQQMDGAIETASQVVGVDLEKDFLGSFGDEWGFYVDPAIGGGGMMGLTLLNRLRDPAKADEIFKKTQKGITDFAAQNIADKQIHLAFHSTRLDDLEINYLGIPFLTPSWAIRDGNLYAALYPQVVAAAAEQVSGKGKSILDNENFAAIRARLGGKNITSFQFEDLQRTAIDSYGSWLGVSHLAQLGDLFGVPAPPMVMPQLSKLMAQLGPAAQISYSDATGFHLRSLTPFPGAEILGTDPMSASAPQQAMLVSILLPALNRAREQANRVKDAANLREIGLGAVMYSNRQKNGKFPDSLAEIAKTEDFTPNVFVSPRNGSAPPPANLNRDQAAAWVEDHSDYVWLGKGKNNAAPADQILAYEKFEGITEGINILYCDGHVEFKTLDVARQLVERAGKGKE